MNPGTYPAPTRDDWMDVLRGAAIIAVIAYHASAIAGEFEQMALPPALVRFNTGIAPLRMPTLMLLSGLLLPRSLAKPAPSYVFGKVSRILYPMLLWSGIYWVIGLLRGDWYQPGLHVEFSYLWFLQFLFGYYMAALALERPLATRTRLAHAVLVCSALVATQLTADGSKEQSFALLGAFFFTGSWLAHDSRALSAFFASRWRWLTPVATVAAVLLAMSGWNVASSARFAPITLLAILGLVVLARPAARARLTRPLRWAGRDSLVFYVSHFPVAALVLDLTVQGLHLPRSICIALAFAVPVAVGAALVHLQRRHPAFRRLFRLEPSPVAPTATSTSAIA